VQWDNGEPVEVTTSARDLITAIDTVPEEEGTNQIALTTHLLHIALVRQGFDPPPYGEWLDVLDRYDLIRAVANGSGPTKRGRSGSGRSSSPASPAPTGGRGSKKTTGPSKQQNSS
jgi:hypothetical protein